MGRRISREYIVTNSKILIVDDSRVLRAMLREFCQSAGFKHIDEAADGKEGLKKILSSHPDLVFMDMEMPHMNGLQVCQELQQRHLHDKMIIIMHTTFDGSELKSQAFDAGITDFVTKPLSGREVTARSLAHLERHFLNQQRDADYRRIQTELQGATILQNILLPHEEVLEGIRNDSGLDIAHYYHPATELAGDYLSVRKLESNRVALISADVSGHGVTAALYAFSLHTLLEDKVLESHPPGEVLERLNAQLHSLMMGGNFVTAFLGVVDMDHGLMHYAAAAAPPPVLLSGGKATLINTDGYLLGTLKQSTYTTHSIPFTKGDALVIYSDALIETASPRGEFMSEQEVIDVLCTSKSKDAGGLLRNLIAAFYTGYSKNPIDDLSMLVCKA